MNNIQRLHADAALDGLASFERHRVLTSFDRFAALRG